MLEKTQMAIKKHKQHCAQIKKVKKHNTDNLKRGKHRRHKNPWCSRRI